MRGPATPKEARALAETVIAHAGLDLAQHARAHAHERARIIAFESAESIARAVRRERAIAACLAPSTSALVQAGLFDISAVKRKQKEDEYRNVVRRTCDERADLIEADGMVRPAHEPELSMLLFLCPRA